MKKVLALSKNNNVDESIDTDRNVKLVSGRDFYKDYISFLKDKKEKIIVELDRHIQKRSAIINTFRSHFDTFQVYYIICSRKKWKRLHLTTDFYFTREYECGE